MIYNLQTSLVNTAVTYASIVYIIANTKKDVSNTANVIISNTAKNVAATSKGHFNIFVAQLLKEWLQQVMQKLIIKYS